MNGIILEAKCRWVEEGEKPTRYFANVEKRHYENKVLTELDINGDRVNDPPDILEEENKFFQQIHA